MPQPGLVGAYCDMPDQAFAAALNSLRATTSPTLVCCSLPSTRILISRLASSVAPSVAGQGSATGGTVSLRTGGGANGRAEN